MHSGFGDRAGAVAKVVMGARGWGARRVVTTTRRTQARRRQLVIPRIALDQLPRLSITAGRRLCSCLDRIESAMLVLACCATTLGLMTSAS